jgi:pyruvate ferredoxin oxidoreductase delta subunit
MEKFPQEKHLKKKATWKEVPVGGLITEPGSSRFNKTGSWKSFRPVKNEKCISCLMCYVYCPENCIMVKEGKMIGFDLNYCKGCGICSKICPVKAIEMKEEAQFHE